MNDFSHVDIFATKGIEYLIVIGFLILIIPFWKYLNSPVNISPVFKFSSAKAVVNRITSKIPQGIFLDPTHSWAFMQRSGLVRVGVDNFLLSTTGPVNYIDLHQPGEVIKRGDIMGRLMQGRKSLNVYSPVSGKIQKTNKHPDKSEQSSDIFDKSWLYAIEPENWSRDMKNMLFAKKAEDWIKKEIDRLRDFLAFATQKYGYNPGMVILQEGGAIMDEALRIMPEDIWAEFQAEFINANKMV
ncbi:MAG: hypothetical protein HQ509_01725 [Candidatus Marinimicrobia bacterium]|nr:hypothetical protein [Candidatus Neomarinimicrobiota bacterium]